MDKYVIGIDVSREKLDLCLFSGGVVLDERVVENSCVGIRKALQALYKAFAMEPQMSLLCAEYTGRYTYPLCCVCGEESLPLWLENPLQIKYRTGIQRGRDDRLDARRIAACAAQFSGGAKLFSLPDKAPASLAQLVGERDMYVVDKAKYKGQLADQERFMDKEDYRRKSRRLKALIRGLEGCISQVEKEIQNLIEGDETLARQHKLLCSVDGTGERTAVKMIVETNAFRSFDDPRKFCCHAGIAPFEYRSGSSIRSRRHVSQRADKSIKALLHMAALVVATRMKGELHGYYERKVAGGKNKMLVLNAVRAKLVHRMFAVIKHECFYQKNYLHPLA